jgi:DAACS family dicarboxylate/amino acid:cation (Na+ or H+) symporter
LGWWHSTPLYLRIIGALFLGVGVALLLSPKALPLGGMPFREQYGPQICSGLAVPSQLILRLLNALAPALILIAVMRALINSEIRGRMARRLIGLLLLNTLVAILIGLFVANWVQPGRHAQLTPPAAKEKWVDTGDAAGHRMAEFLDKNGLKPAPTTDPLTQFLGNVPQALLEPLSTANKVVGAILVAVAFGIALRRSRDREIRTVSDAVEVVFDTMLVVLHWIIDLVPIGVFGIVASIIGTQGFAPFKALGWFVLAVMLALLLQTIYYLVRVRLGSWVNPFQLLSNTRDALVMAFSTASSTATMPVTYERLRNRVGLREESASMGSLVGANFNNDGTALYEAMSALFIAQMLGMELSLWQQVLVVLTSVIASVGAAGIPEAGLVTMTLVFTAVGLPTPFIALLLTVDWFLDRCRTTINVMGDMNVSCILDGKTREESPPPQVGAPVGVTTA